MRYANSLSAGELKGEDHVSFKLHGFLGRFIGTINGRLNGPVVTLANASGAILAVGKNLKLKSFANAVPAKSVQIRKISEVRFMEWMKISRTEDYGPSSSRGNNCLLK